MADEAPFVSAIERFGDSLPVGFVAQGTPIRQFVFGGLKGKLRKELLNARNMYRETIVGLKHALAQLGPLQPPPMSFVECIPACDAEYIQFLLSARRLKDGVFIIEVLCGDEDAGMVEGCGSALQAHVPAINVGFIEGNTPIQYHPQSGLPFQEISFKYPLSNGAQADASVKYRVATLKDQAEFVERAEAAAAVDRKKAGGGRRLRMGEFIFDQFASLMIDFNGSGRGLTVEELENLDLDMLDAFTNAMGNYHPPHVDLDVDIVCGQCKRTQRVELPIKRWLDPFVVRMPSGSSPEM